MKFIKMIAFLFFSHHHMIVVVFSNVDDANQTTVDPEMFPDGLNSAQNAYRAVASTMPAAYRAIVVQDEEWPADGIFTIGGGNATYNPPLRTGFAYRAFIRIFSKQDINVWYFTNSLLLTLLIYYRATQRRLACLHPAVTQRFLKIPVSYELMCLCISLSS